MSPAARSTVETIAKSPLYGAVVRLLITALTLPIGWAAKELVSMDHRVTVIETARAYAVTDYLRRMDALEKHDNDEVRVAHEMSLQITSLRGEMATTRELLIRFEKALERRP